MDLVLLLIINQMDSIIMQAIEDVKLVQSMDNEMNKVYNYESYLYDKFLYLYELTKKLNLKLNLNPHINGLDSNSRRDINNKLDRIYRKCERISDVCHGFRGKTHGDYYFTMCNAEEIIDRIDCIRECIKDNEPIPLYIFDHLDKKHWFS